MLKFHIIGVNQKNSCIAIPSKFPKSGTIVVIADVNLAKAITKQYIANIIYINVNIFGGRLNTIHTPTETKNKNIPTKLDATIDMLGITSTGNTTFFTK